MLNVILVAGATGRTGQIIIRKLIQKGYQPHALVRDLPAAKKILGENVICHQGDVREMTSLQQAMQGIDAVISAVGSQTPVGKNCPKRVDFRGVANLVKAAEFNQVKRFILISSIAVTHPEHPLNCFGKILDWKRKGEETLQNSPLDYAIIRPGGLLDSPGGMRDLIVDQGDQIVGTISRETVAETCLVALQYPRPLRVCFEIIETEQKGTPHWNTLFGALSPDPKLES